MAKTGFIQEFKEFAFKGNVIDMAVGVIIGGAFGKIVSSLVADVIMPPIAALMGDTNFADLKYVLKEAVVDAEGVETVAAVAINYGSFIQTIVDFLIIAICIFFAIKGLNSMKKKEAAVEEAPAAPSNEEVLLAEIRDLLKKQQ
ncbi:MAG: large-conductance mechanosensitive channel protein MscL [Phocaeicola sp.]|nr:large-conductance mechanosensitive channel protein MscL [Phocaeicola sp.]MDD7448166.1 large-conductance mechanosensitive channel protein MscL [Prevotellaceae bacterium]MDY5938687.1 large-conductance mechanosensitive channel protein MscL [Phocaeicola sp.]